MDKDDLKELLIKCWMTHDGMWFYHCLKECGMEKTNKINKSAVRSLASIEIKRIIKAFKIKNITSFNDLKFLFEKALNTFKADFMVLSFHFPNFNQLHCEMHKCWAYEGINRIGVIEEYECAIYERIEGWFETLEIKYDVKPNIEGCLMHRNGKCVRVFNFYFEN